VKQLSFYESLAVGSIKIVQMRRKYSG